MKRYLICCSALLPQRLSTPVPDGTQGVTAGIQARPVLITPLGRPQLQVTSSMMRSPSEDPHQPRGVLVGPTNHFTFPSSYGQRITMAIQAPVLQKPCSPTRGERPYIPMGNIHAINSANGGTGVTAGLCCHDNGRSFWGWFISRVNYLTPFWPDLASPWPCWKMVDEGHAASTVHPGQLQSGHAWGCCSAVRVATFSARWWRFGLVGQRCPPPT